MKKEKQETKETKKKNRLFDIFLVVMIIAIIAGSFLYNKSLIKPEVMVGGQSITVDMTVQDLINAGFMIDESFSGKGDLNLATQPQIPGESYTSTFYYLFTTEGSGTPHYANVVFQVYNRDVNSANLRDCQIYAYRYNPGFDLVESHVLINGIDFSDMSKEDAVAALEDLGVKFDSADKNEFLGGDINIIFGKSGDYSYIIETDYDGKTITNIEVKRKV